MGYSTFIVARTPQLRDEMLAFLNREVKDLQDLPFDIETGIKNYWVGADILSDVYNKADKKTALGYERNIGNDASLFFMNEVLKWAADKVGKRIKASKLDSVDRELSKVKADDALVPYVVYAGEGFGHATHIKDFKAHILAEQARLAKFNPQRGNPYLKAYYKLKLRFFEVMNNQPGTKSKLIKQIGKSLLNKNAGIDRFSQMVQVTLARLDKQWELDQKVTKASLKRL